MSPEALPLLMFAGLAAFLFSGFPVAFVLGGLALGFGALGIAFDAFTFVQFFTIVPRIWGGIAESLILTAVPMFIFMGTMLERSGVAGELLHALEMILARVPGGLALAVTLMGTIMAATTGIIGASVVMMTLLALPVMLRARYDPAFAAGTVAAAGTLGILIPPSVMLVVMADLLSRSVGVLFFAALGPGLVLAALYAVYVLAVGWLAPNRAPRPDPGRLDTDGRGLARILLAGFVAPSLLIALVLGSILAGWASPTEAAGVGAFGAAVLALMMRPLTQPADDAGRRFRPALRAFPRLLRDVTERVALTNAMLFAIFVGASAFSLVFRALGGDDAVLGVVDSLALGPWGLLAVLMGLVFVLGFFFDWIEITLIILPVFAPIVERLDFGAHVAPADTLYWFAILMAVNLQTSFLTPPFGFALFYVKGAAPPALAMETIWRGGVPFVVLQLAVLSLVVAFPELALWLPHAALP